MLNHFLCAVRQSRNARSQSSKLVITYYTCAGSQHGLYCFNLLNVGSVEWTLPTLTSHTIHAQTISSSIVILMAVFKQKGSENETAKLPQMFHELPFVLSIHYTNPVNFFFREHECYMRPWTQHKPIHTTPCKCISKEILSTFWPVRTYFKSYSKKIPRVCFSWIGLNELTQG